MPHEAQNQRIHPLGILLVIPDQILIPMLSNPEDGKMMQVSFI